MSVVYWLFLHLQVWRFSGKVSECDVLSAPLFSNDVKKNSQYAEYYSGNALELRTKNFAVYVGKQPKKVKPLHIDKLIIQNQHMVCGKPDVKSKLKKLGHILIPLFFLIDCNSIEISVCYYFFQSK